MKDLISIIIPIYNTEKYLEKCLDSVISQTYKNIEIMLILDGPTDSSKEIAYNYQKKDKRIKIIERENKGAFYSRTEGAVQSSGKYLAFVDSDDFIEKNYIEVMYENLIRNKVDIVRCYYKVLKNNKYIYENKIIPESKVFRQNDNYNEVYDLLYSSIYFNSMCRQLISKEIFNKINIKKLDYDINYGEDLLCEIELLKIAKSIMIIQDYLYIYNQNEDSVTFIKNKNVIEKKIKSVCKVNKKMYDDIDIINHQNKEELYQLITIKFFYNLFNQYMNLVLVNNDEDKLLPKIYANKSYDCFFNRKLEPKYLNRYNFLYRKGITKLKNKKQKTLVYYIKNVMYPIFKIKDIILKR